MSDEELISVAAGVVGAFRPGRTCVAGSVAAAIRTRAGHVYTGICIDAPCSIGFCAEHAAIAEMLKARESEIELMVAIDDAGHVLPPCGRCRELMWQVSSKNRDARVLVTRSRSMLLSELLPSHYQSFENA